MPRIQRKRLITVAEVTPKGSNTPIRKILGEYTPDSSIEFNNDLQTASDILGKTHADVEKTEPVQTFDPHYVMESNALDDYMVKAALKNDIDAYNGVFTFYIIAEYMNEGGSGTDAFYTVKHSGCSLIPTSLGGESYLGMPYEAHFSNDITEGTVNEISEEFTFTPA